uniref:Uncharacterized protein n=1 Tax=Podoviridae sp. ctdet19 TaxID=2825262 RepID=A0A8S5U7U8_9CAUD|nr:MAG TPA: hypothetical protein [Podoviridae sp. ctdet19]
MTKGVQSTGLPFVLWIIKRFPESAQKPVRNWAYLSITSQSIYPLHSRMFLILSAVETFRPACFCSTFPRFSTVTT